MKTSSHAVSFAASFCALFLSLVAPSSARAAGADDERTLCASAGGAYVTHKSKLVKSNDTGLAYDYGLRVLGGGSKNILAEVRGSMTTTSFTLSSGTMSQQELLFLFGSHFGWGYVAGGAGTRQLKAKAEAGELDAYSRTYGGGLGLNFALLRGMAAFTDLTATIPLETKEAKQQTVTVGTAMAGQAGVLFDLTRRNLDLSIGVRYSTLAVTFGGAGGGETMTAPFLGLRWGFDP